MEAQLVRLRIFSNYSQSPYDPNEEKHWKIVMRIQALQMVYSFAWSVSISLLIRDLKSASNLTAAWNYPTSFLQGRRCSIMPRLLRGDWFLLDILSVKMLDFICLNWTKRNYLERREICLNRKRLGSDQSDQITISGGNKLSIKRVLSKLFNFLNCLF